MASLPPLYSDGLFTGRRELDPYKTAYSFVVYPMPRTSEENSRKRD